MTKKVNYALSVLYLFGKVVPMDMKTYLQQASPVQREELARAVSSSVGYFYLIGGRHRRPSSKLAQALVIAEPKLTLPELRPDIWGGVASVSASSAARAVDANDGA